MSVLFPVFTQLLVDLAPFYILSVLIVSTYFLVTHTFSTEAVAFASTALLVLYQGFVSPKPLAFLENMVSAPVIAILGLTVMGRFVACTGIFNKVACFIVKTRRKDLIPIGLLLVCYVSSAFMNNTPVVVLLISLISIFGKQVGISNSRIMMPIAFAASLGGMVTLLGSSTNLLIHSKAEELGTELGFFWASMPALFVGAFGMAYVFLLTFILPLRESSDESHRKFFFVLNPTQSVRSIFSTVGIREIKNILYNCKINENLVIEEVLITEKSELIGFNILSLEVAEYFDAYAIGIEGASGKIAPGSKLIVIWNRENLDCMDNKVVATKKVAYILSQSNGLKVISSFVGVIILSGIFGVSLALAVFSTLGLLTIFRAVNAKDICGSIEIKLLLMLIYSLSIGKSLETMNLLEVFAEFLYHWTHALPVISLICIIFAIVTLLNEVMSNNAVGLIFTPVVLKLSYMIGINPIYLLWTLIFAANSAFATPFGYQVNLLVMEAGKYKYSDYLKFGLPLNVIVLIGYIAYLWVFSELDLFHRVSLPG